MQGPRSPKTKSLFTVAGDIQGRFGQISTLFEQHGELQLPISFQGERVALFTVLHDGQPTLIVEKLLEMGGVHVEVPTSVSAE